MSKFKIIADERYAYRSLILHICVKVNETSQSSIYLMIDENKNSFGLFYGHEAGRESMKSYEFDNLSRYTVHIGRSIITRYDKSDCCVRTCFSNVLKNFYKSVKRMKKIV